MEKGQPPYLQLDDKYNPALVQCNAFVYLSYLCYHKSTLVASSLVSTGCKSSTQVIRVECFNAWTFRGTHGRADLSPLVRFRLGTFSLQRYPFWYISSIQDLSHSSFYSHIISTKVLLSFSLLRRHATRPYLKLGEALCDNTRHTNWTMGSGGQPYISTLQTKITLIKYIHSAVSSAINSWWKSTDWFRPV